MTVPNVPGFMDRARTLASEWPQPRGAFSPDLWPSSVISTFEQFPSEWLVIEQHDYSSTSGSTGVSCFLTSAEGWNQSRASHDWSGRHLGDYGFEDEPPDNDTGLSQQLGSAQAEFFVQVQRNHRLRPTTVDLSLAFQWFWDAVRDGNNWFYLDGAGIEHPLVRSTITTDSYQVEIRALEFRRYLARRGLVAVVQYDHVVYAQSDPFEQANFEFDGDWSSFIWTPVNNSIGDGFNSFSRLLGKRLVTGIEHGPNPLALDFDNPARANHPTYVYGIEPETGQPLDFTSDPDSLSNYFGANPDAPHYLTPVYFDPRVLNRYRDEPSKYEITSSQLSCLGIWSIAIGESTTGLVEVYLGDLGRDLPWQERPHWKAHNVLPGGTMNEDRFRRDFLAQWVGEPTTLEFMRDQLSSLRRTSMEILGFPLIRELDGTDLLELTRLRLPTTTEQRELLLPVLTLAKAFVDAIDERALRLYLGDESNDRSLALLEKLAVVAGGDASSVQPFRALYKLRSSGGLAHWGGSEVARVFDRLGLDGMTPAQIIEFFATGLATACQRLEELVRTLPPSRT